MPINKLGSRYYVTLSQNAFLESVVLDNISPLSNSHYGLIRIRGTSNDSPFVGVDNAIFSPRSTTSIYAHPRINTTGNIMTGSEVPKDKWIWVAMMYTFWGGDSYGLSYKYIDDPAVAEKLLLQTVNDAQVLEEYPSPIRAGKYSYGSNPLLSPAEDYEIDVMELYSYNNYVRLAEVEAIIAYFKGQYGDIIGT